MLPYYLCEFKSVQEKEKEKRIKSDEIIRNSEPTVYRG